MHKRAKLGKIKRMLFIGISTVTIIALIAGVILSTYPKKPETEKAVAIIQFFPREEELDNAVKSLHEGGHQPWRSNPLEVARIESPAQIAALLSQEFHSFELSYWKDKDAEVLSKNAKQTAIIYLKSYKNEIWYISKITLLKSAEPSHAK